MFEAWIVIATGLIVSAEDELRHPSRTLVSYCMQHHGPINRTVLLRWTSWLQQDACAILHATPWTQWSNSNHIYQSKVVWSGHNKETCSKSNHIYQSKGVWSGHSREISSNSNHIFIRARWYDLGTAGSMLFFQTRLSEQGDMIWAQPEKHAVIPITFIRPMWYDPSTAEKYSTIPTTYTGCEIVSYICCR